MTDLQAIRARSSRRSYLGPLSPPELQTLTDLACTLCAQSGITFRLEANAPRLFGGFSASYGLFKGVHSFLVIYGPAEDDFLHEKAGYFGERFVLEATKMELGTCWVGGTFDQKSVGATLPEGQTLVAVITVGPVHPQLSFKERALHSLVRRSPRPVASFYTSEELPPDWFIRGVKAAAVAPSALAKQPVRFGWHGGTASVRIPNTATFQHIDLGIAKLHFELGAKQGHFALGTPAEYTQQNTAGEA